MLATIPSPSQGVWHLGPFPVRAYALCILLGIVVAVLITRKRWADRGGDPAVVLDVATWAVPFGVVGGRLYHVISSPDAYFGEGGDPVKAFYIWEGGLGIWGAVLLGGVGAWIGCRQAGVRLPAFGDAVAPGIVLAQAIGRFGNWFNNELYGRETDLPWALEIHRWDSSAGRALEDAAGNPIVIGTFHPAFLYEALWNVGVFVALLVVDRRRKIGHGRLFALYVALYTLGRVWIEALRIDPAEQVLGVRLNVWTSIVVFAGATLYMVICARLRPGRDETVRRTVEPDPDPEPPARSAADPADDPVDDAGTEVTATTDKDVGATASPDA